MAQVYRNAGPEAAIIAGRDPEMDVIALKGKASILSVIAGHTKTGDYARSVRIVTAKGSGKVLDRVVMVTDPNAISIEYGHMWVTPEGKRIKRIKPLMIVHRAFSRLG